MGAKFTCVLNSEDLNNNEVTIKNNHTKEEETISLDVLIYYLDEKINAGMVEDFEEDSCQCGGNDDECGGHHTGKCCGGHCHHEEE